MPLFLCCFNSVSRFFTLPFTLQASCGKPCSSRRGVCFGSNATDIEVPVPVGISVSISNPGEPVRLIGDLDKPDQRLLVAQGGYGGTPVTNYLGSPGEARSIVLDLKVGLCIFPFFFYRPSS